MCSFGVVNLSPPFVRFMLRLRSSEILLILMTDKLGGRFYITVVLKYSFQD